MKHIICISLSFLKLSGMEKSQIALCNLTPFKQEFAYQVEQEPTKRLLIKLKPFAAGIITFTNNAFLKHNSFNKIIEPESYQVNIPVKPDSLFVVSSNHFSQSASQLHQTLSVYNNVSKQYMQDIEIRGAQAVVAHIMDQKNYDSLYPVYTGHKLIKREDLGSQGWFHTYNYCTDPTTLAILNVIIKWLPQHTREQWEPYLAVSKKYQEIMTGSHKKDSDVVEYIDDSLQENSGVGLPL